jgi:putative transposase
MLVGDIETACHEFLRKRALGEKSVFVHAIGGMEDHVHLAISVPPTIKPSDLIGDLKGASSYEINRRLGLKGKVLEWQHGYGIVSFGTMDAPWVIEYIGNQRQRHANGKSVDRLERIEAFDA